MAGVRLELEERTLSAARKVTDYDARLKQSANTSVSKRPDGTIAPATRATLTAFGMTRRAGRSAQNDDVLAAVLDAGTRAVCLVGKTHDYHVTHALGTTLDENLRGIAESVAQVVSKGREAIFDAEHFFDGYKADPAYDLSTRTVKPLRETRVAADFDSDTAVKAPIR